MCLWHHIGLYVSECMYVRVKTPAQKASPGKWLPVALRSHNLIKAFLCGPVTLSVLSAQAEESGRLDEVIDHRAAAFLAVAALKRRAGSKVLRGRAGTDESRCRSHTSPRGFISFHFANGSYSVN